MRASRDGDRPRPRHPRVRKRALPSRHLPRRHRRPCERACGGAWGHPQTPSRRPLRVRRHRRSLPSVFPPARERLRRRARKRPEPAFRTQRHPPSRHQRVRRPSRRRQARRPSRRDDGCGSGFGCLGRLPFGEPHPARAPQAQQPPPRRALPQDGGCGGAWAPRRMRRRLPSPGAPRQKSPRDGLGLHGGAARAAGLRRRGRGAASAAGASSPATAAALRVRRGFTRGLRGRLLRSFACSGRYLLGDGIDGRALGARRALASRLRLGGGSAEAAAGVASAGID